jgi:hypothetical protein
VGNGPVYIHKWEYAAKINANYMIIGSLISDTDGHVEMSSYDTAVGKDNRFISERGISLASNDANVSLLKDSRVTVPGRFDNGGVINIGGVRKTTGGCGW